MKENALDHHPARNNILHLFHCRICVALRLVLEHSLTHMLFMICCGLQPLQEYHHF